MAKSYPYGFKALFESMYNAERAEEASNEITNIGLGLTESVSFLDAIDAGLLSDDEVENDMNAEDDIIDSSDDLFRKVDDILPDDDDDVQLDDIAEESIDMALENYINAHEYTEDLYGYV